jgi:hypothetical protein
MEIEAQMPTTSYNELQRVVVRHLEALGLTHIQRNESRSNMVKMHHANPQHDGFVA